MIPATGVCAPDRTLVAVRAIALYWYVVAALAIAVTATQVSPS